MAYIICHMYWQLIGATTQLFLFLSLDKYHNHGNCAAGLWNSTRKYHIILASTIPFPKILIAHHFKFFINIAEWFKTCMRYKDTLYPFALLQKGQWTWSPCRIFASQCNHRRRRSNAKISLINSPFIIFFESWKFIWNNNCSTCFFNQILLLPMHTKPLCLRGFIHKWAILFYKQCLHLSVVYIIINKFKTAP